MDLLKLVIDDGVKDRVGVVVVGGFVVAGA